MKIANFLTHDYRNLWAPLNHFQLSLEVVQMFELTLNAPSALKKLVHPVSGKAEAVIKAKGGQTKYEMKILCNKMISQVHVNVKVMYI